MHVFQPVKTARFTFTLQELNFKAVRQILSLSSDFQEQARTVFLQHALLEFQWAKGYEMNTLDDLTVQERLFIEACYLANVAEQSDFELGNGRYSDFLRYEQQYKISEIEIGKMPGDDDVWLMQPLTGGQIIAIEEQVLSLENPERIDWIVFAMASQLYRKGEQRPSVSNDKLAYDEWLTERAETLLNLPESAFIALLQGYFGGMAEMTHLFAVNFDDDGLFLLPIDEKGGAIAPARFRPNAKISETAKQLLS